MSIDIADFPGKRRNRYRERTRFLALRACWYILRGYGVAWNLEFTDNVVRSRGRRLFVADCTNNGAMVSARHVYLQDPEPQEDAPGDAR